MREIKEVIVYSNGDSNDLATWSNVPYFFCRELEKRGIKVDKVDIHVNKDSALSIVSRLLAKFKKKLITRCMVFLLKANRLSKDNNS